MALYKEPSGIGSRLSGAAFVEHVRGLLGTERFQMFVGMFTVGHLRTTREVALTLGVSVPTARRYLQEFARGGVLVELSRSVIDPRAVWSGIDNSLNRKIDGEET